MVNPIPANKRLYSHIDDGVNADTVSQQRREYVKEHKIPSDPNRYALVSSKWYEEYLQGNELPLVKAKGAAGEKIDEDLSKQLEEWFGITEDITAVRIGSMFSPDAPIAIRRLQDDARIDEECGVDGDFQLLAIEIQSQFLDKSANYHPHGREMKRDTLVRDIELRDNESILVAKPVERLLLGRVGLTNMGNTCFMNSSLQALLHIPELIHYFGSGNYENDLNPDNPIGCGGYVAKAFADLIKQLYRQNTPLGSIRPHDFLRTIGRFNRSFASRIQQDSQEFTVFLLDSLHEDLNRVNDKPATQKPELGECDAVTTSRVVKLASDSWDVHKKRNDSQIMDLFTGMYKSTLVCPVCHKISITFDPFFDVTLPLPNNNVWMKQVILIRNSNSNTGDEKVSSVEIALSPTSTVMQMKQQIAEVATGGMNVSNLVVGDVFGSKFYRLLADNAQVADTIDPTDDIVVYELVNNNNSNNTSNNNGEASVSVYTRFENTGCGTPFFVKVDENMTTDSIKETISSELSRLYAVEDNSISLLSINIFDGAVEDIVYGYGGDRLRKLWPRYELQGNGNEPRVNESDEPFEDLEPGKPEDEVAENLPTPATSPNASPYSPSASSSNSMSPLASAGPLENNAESDPTSNDLDATYPFRGFNLHNTVFVVDIDRQAKLPSLPDLRALPNPVSENAKKERAKQHETTLEDCLKSFSEPEVLGEHDLWYCPRCKEFRQAQKQMELWQIPDVLMIHLKRFSGMHSISRKVNDNVVFPLEGLDLTQFVSKESPSASLSEIDNNYDLIAVDNHYGGIGGGHYTSVVKDPFTGDWLEFNDSFVSPASPDRVCTNAAYLLFYKRRSTIGRCVDEAVQVADVLRAGELSDHQKPEVLVSEEAPPLANSSKDDSVFKGSGNVLGVSSAETNNASLPWAND